ncbi:hypothetical protein [Aggregatilinea lenta]|uniref:hypothetical protein n=1 Tax=Aggregatilinea lenta TaxID=913108 RepID=UPI0013C37999|nr:hypothetical protein [Aggregatilinea lenta]
MGLLNQKGIASHFGYADSERFYAADYLLAALAVGLHLAEISITIDGATYAFPWAFVIE